MSTVVVVFVKCHALTLFEFGSDMIALHRALDNIQEGQEYRYLFGGEKVSPLPVSRRLTTPDFRVRMGET